MPDDTEQLPSLAMVAVECVELEPCSCLLATTVAVCRIRSSWQRCKCEVVLHSQPRIGSRETHLQTADPPCLDSVTFRAELCDAYPIHPVAHSAQKHA